MRRDEHQFDQAEQILAQAIPASGSSKALKSVAKKAAIASRIITLAAEKFKRWAEGQSANPNGDR